MQVGNVAKPIIMETLPSLERALKARMGDSSHVINKKKKIEKQTKRKGSTKKWDSQPCGHNRLRASHTHSRSCRLKTVTFVIAPALTVSISICPIVPLLPFPFPPDCRGRCRS